MATKWGICSAGKISNDFVVALRTLDAEEHQVAAVAARSLESAQAFAATHKIESAYGSYDELAMSEKVDIIYIGSINSQHLSLCKLFLNHGKPVLCEKPLGLNADEVKEITDLAKEKNLFMMEGVWSRFFPVYAKVREVISSGRIGDIKCVMVSFGYPLITNERLAKKDLGGGALLDLGIYTVQLALMVFGGQMPLSVASKGFLTENGVDETSSTTLLFPDNGIAVLTCTGTCTLPNEADIVGTKGRMRIFFPFWCPTHLQILDEKGTENKSFILPKPSQQLNFDNGTGMRFEAQAVRDCLQQGLKEHSLVTHEDSFKFATILDQARHSLGYFHDKELAK
ncbi:trans-1,2-dihydrobenzene-1,2-diol dehydrogenase-like [Anneissia japonica]|uniref:trans-1,2-dihydrobenzene-1,2-diol dehydrogenase-like n=1 Tax=Anneissia japonica TaxID=1529436 RepID=UPI001425655D|nr:trans-1,2-dihydrobenzene-1,2-diol dehydrogenase-like [Anneissia japonica]